MTCTAMCIAQPGGGGGGKRLDLVTCEMVPEFTSVKQGTTFRVAVVLNVAPKWHVYWAGQNDSGMPVGITVTSPQEPTIGPVKGPAPQRHVASGDILDYIHEGRVVYTFEVKAPANTASGQGLELSANIEYLVCDDNGCIPGKANVKTRVTIVKDESTGPASSVELIKGAIEKQPKETGWKEAVEAKMQGEQLTLMAKDEGTTEMTFYPADRGNKLIDPIKSGTVKGKMLMLQFESMMKKVEGVLEIKGGKHAGVYVVSYHSMDGLKPEPKPEPTIPQAPAAPKPVQ